MTITLEVPEDLAAHLKAVGIGPEEASRYVVSRLVDVAAKFESDATELRVWWEGLNQEQRDEERRSLESRGQVADSGRDIPASEVYARIRAKHSRPFSA